MEAERHDVVTGVLLCAIGNSGKHLWSFRGGLDLFLYEHAVVAARVTMTETYTGLKQHHDREEAPSDHRSAAAQQARLSAKGARPVAELLQEHPENRLVPSTVVRDARLHKGLLTSRLTLTLEPAETLTWMWTAPNPPFQDVQAAVERMLGFRLTVR